MKNVSLLITVLLYSSLHAQITLENTYTDAYSSTGHTHRDFGIVNLVDSTYMYYLIDLDNSEFTLYNFNHSVYKNVKIAEAYQDNIYNISYISKDLFDCDTSNIEYLFSYHDVTTRTYSIKVYREDSTKLFESKGARVTTCFGCLPIVKKVINKTPNGTKMILGYYTNDDIKVYSLCGKLPAGYESVRSNDDDFGNVSSYPNPSVEYTRVEYVLPKGVKNGKIIFYNLQGIVVKELLVDNRFDHLLLSTDDLPTGTYVFNLQTSVGVSDAKKMIKIR